MDYGKEYLDKLFEMTKELIDEAKKNENKTKAIKKFEEKDRNLRIKITSEDKFFSAEYIKNVYNLNFIEWVCFLISITKEALNYYEFNIDSVEMASDIYSIDYQTKKNLEHKMISLCFDKKRKIDARIFDFVMSNGNSECDFKEIKVFFPNSENLQTERENYAVKISNICKKTKKNIYFFISGEKGIGKKTLVKRSSNICESGLVIVDLAKCEESENDFGEIMTAAFREVIILKGFLCFENFDSLKKNSFLRYNFIFDNSKNFTNITFFLSQTVISSEIENESIELLYIKLKKLNSAQTSCIWKESLKKIEIPENLNFSELANVFSFTPGQIKKTVRFLSGSILWGKKINQKEIYAAARNISEANFGGNASRIKSFYNWDDLILSDDLKSILKNACARIKFKSVVFEKWRMNKRLLYGNGLSLLFAGPSGTGKTMAAGIIAGELGLELYRVDLSHLVSKYIGETEKNLNNVFDEAKRSNVALLFDETDALFSKRTDVKDSRDRGANIEISYLLQKMEEFDGVCVMTTNLLENIDKAFFRRITYIIRFTLPNKLEREQIWKKMFSKYVPLAKDIDFDFLSKFEISGGNIKNAAVSAAFLAAQKKEKIENRHLVKALVEEFKKQGNTPIASEFEGYAHMMR
ncbi:MAG: ATP-binding protein [Oscillospiraceae bacterium]|jgi:hypothetical protein|nr:ATP-binding protein [Oscillospiraceae bacterium]